jgi:ergothioneine biosynthesis protein EgtB
MTLTQRQSDPHARRLRLLERLTEARANTDSIFGILRPEVRYDRPIPERHRIIFYFGHLEAFDWNLLSARALGLKSFHPEFDKLFAFGIDPVGGGLPTDQPSDWPSLEEIAGYNLRVRQELDKRLATASASAASSELDALLNVAIEHRLMHSETLAYMFHHLPVERKAGRASNPASAGARRDAKRMIEIPAGQVVLGLRRTEDVFGWDNEFEEHPVSVPAFAIDECMVTNGQFLDFVRAGGYEERAFWSDAAWNWIQTEGIRHPKFWTRKNGEWFYRAMFEELPLPLDWPAYVSQAEAAAHARWAGKELPTEAQWQRAAYGSPQGEERPYPWGNDEPEPSRGVFDFNRWDAAPVNSHLAGKSAFGASDMLGNGWEWTSTKFEPFPGFEPFPFYPGYSANFFDGQHFVMKGGSARTAACMLRSSFRNWFQPHYQCVYAGFRCVAN